MDSSWVKIAINITLFIIIGIIVNKIFNFFFYNDKTIDSDAEKILDKNFVWFIYSIILLKIYYFTK